MKEYKCIKGDGINFTEGNIYQLQENGNMEGDDGYTFEPAGCSTAVEWLEEHDFKFESTSKFKNLDTFEQVIELLESGCEDINCRGECAFNALGVCGMAFLHNAMSRMDGASEVNCGSAHYNRQDYMAFASLNEPRN